MRRSSSLIDCNGVVLDDKLVDECDPRILSVFDGVSSRSSDREFCVDSESPRSTGAVVGFQSG